MRTRLAALLLSLLCPVMVLAEDIVNSKDWPQWRGPHRDNISQETGLLKQWPKVGPKLLWNSKDVSAGKSVGVGYSSISIAAGRIFTMGDRDKEGFVFAINQDTGKELWATRIAARQGDGPRSTPTVDGDRVYALSPQGNLVCLKVGTGDLVWSKDLVKDFKGRSGGWRYSESPTVDGNQLVCTPGAEDAGLVALDKLTGAVIWKAKTPQCGGAGYASIVTAEIGGVRQYITLLGHDKGGGVVGVDAKTGKLLWNYTRISNSTANIPTSLVKNDLVFCSTGYGGGGSALLKIVPSGEGGFRVEELYYFTSRQLQNHHGGMVLLGDYVYGGHGHNNGNPFCLNLVTGKFAWGPEDRGPGAGSAAVAYADGHLYFRYQDNVMALIEATPTAYHLTGQFNLPGDLGRGWQQPVILDGRLYIRGNNQLLCFDVKQH